MNPSTAFLITECPTCGSTNLNANMRDDLGPLCQCRDCGRIISSHSRELCENPECWLHGRENPGYYGKD